MNFSLLTFFWLKLFLNFSLFFYAKYILVKHLLKIISKIQFHWYSKCMFASRIKKTVVWYSIHLEYQNFQILQFIGFLSHSVLGTFVHKSRYNLRLYDFHISWDRYWIADIVTAIIHVGWWMAVKGTCVIGENRRAVLLPISLVNDSVTWCMSTIQERCSYAICDQQRFGLACTSTQSDHDLLWSLVYSSMPSCSHNRQQIPDQTGNAYADLCLCCPHLALW